MGSTTWKLGVLGKRDGVAVLLWDRTEYVSGRQRGRRRPLGNA
jgi:hypothetical protein